MSTWYTLSRLVTYTVLVLGFFLAISALGVPLSDFAVLGGVIGVGLGFGLQSLFSNFISGIVLLLDKSLKVGDFVELESGVTGEVRDIKIRATTIVTNDNIDILVPNSEFVSGRVVNWTHRDVLRRLRVPFGVAYGTDKNAVKEAALEAAAAVPFTLSLDGPTATAGVAHRVRCEFAQLRTRRVAQPGSHQEARGGHRRLQLGAAFRTASARHRDPVPAERRAREVTLRPERG